MHRLTHCQQRSERRCHNWWPSQNNNKYISRRGKRAPPHVPRKAGYCSLPYDTNRHDIDTNRHQPHHTHDIVAPTSRQARALPPSPLSPTLDHGDLSLFAHRGEGFHPASCARFSRGGEAARRFICHAQRGVSGRLRQAPIEYIRRVLPCSPRLPPRTERRALQ